MAEQFICPMLSAEQKARLRAPPPPTPSYIAGGVLFRRADFDRVGPFDENLVFGEFVDWFGRARNAGIAEVQVPEIVLRRRLHGDNMTVRQRASATDYLKVVRRELARKRETNTRS
jgi:GT2 family glycosyltransferase